MSGDGTGPGPSNGEDSYVSDDASYAESFDVADAHSLDALQDQIADDNNSVTQSQVGQPTNSAMSRALDDPATGGNANGYLDQDEFDRHNADGNNTVDPTDLAPDEFGLHDLSSATGSSDNSGADRFDGNGLDDLVESGAGNDTIYANGGDDVVFGQWGHDFVSGGDGNDLIFGGTNFDTLRGNAGDDSLYGGGGADSIVGGSGHDYLSGNDGDDVLRGGSGRDYFAFSENGGDDTVVDFTNGLDKFAIYTDAQDIGDITITTSGADVLLSFDGTTVRIENTARSEIEASDFVF